MHTLRRYKRIPLRDSFRVLDRETKHLVGYMSNISIDGVQVVSTAPFDPVVDYQLAIELPWQLAQNSDFKVNANIVWVSPDRVTHFYDAGFQFGSLKAQEKRIIYDLIAQYGMDDYRGADRAGALLH